MKPEEILRYFKRDAIPEVKIGVFGEPGAGKTTLLAAYYGNLRKDKWLDEHKYSILADDGEQGRLLFDEYIGLAEDHAFPTGTSMFAEYSFQLQLQNPQKPSERLTPPPLRIRWYDYPGKWWTQQPSDPGECKSRKEAIHKLLTSQVGMLMFDGAKTRKDFRYLSSVLASFTDEVRRHKLDIEKYATPDDGLTQMYPKHWILALTKSDLFDLNFSAKEFMGSLLAHAGAQLDELGRVIGKEKPYRWAFLLLSSAQGDGKQVIRADKPRGLELIAPIALLAPLEQIGNASIPKKVTKQAMKGTAWTLDKASTLIRWAVYPEASVANATTDPQAIPIATADGLFAILFAVTVPKILEKSGSYLTRRLEKATRDGHIFDAAICAMQMELTTDESKHLYYDDHLIQ